MIYALKSHRITTTKQPNDRYLSCLIHPSSEEKEGYSGSLFSLIEINDIHSRQIGQTLVNLIAREYFRSKENSAAENFEYALKKANELLAQHTQDGQTGWIGNLHSIIGLFYKDELHFTVVGGAQMLILREGKLNNITKDLANSSDEAHPLKTFANITSGPINKNDIIVVLSSESQNILPKKELREILDLNTLEESAVEIAGLIRKNNQLINTLLFETTTKEDLANEPLSNIPETIYIDQSNEPFSAKIKLLAKKQISTKATRVGTAISSNTSKTGDWFKNQAFPLIKSTFNTVYNKVKSNSIKSKTPKTQNYNPSDDSSIHINHYNKNNIGQKLLLIIQSALKPLFHLLTDRKSKPRLFATIGVIALLVLSLSIYLKTRPKDNPKNLHSELQNKYQTALTSDPKTAIAIFQEIAKNESPENAQLIAKAEKQLSLLTNSEIISSPQSDLPLKTQASYFYNNNLYAITDQAIYHTKIAVNNFQQIARLPANSGLITSSTYWEYRKSILIYTNKQQMFEFQISKNTVKPLAISPDNSWESTQLIATLNSNIYQLDNKSGQIWKYSPTSGKYGKGLSYLKSPSNKLIDSLSIDVQSSIYVLTKENRIAKIAKNSISDIVPSNFPNSTYEIKNPIKFSIDEQREKIIIAEPEKITILSLTGKYEKQYVLKQIKIKNIFQPSQSDKLFITTDNQKVIQINI